MRIVRKVDPEGDEAEFLVGDDGTVRHRWVLVGRVATDGMNSWWVTSSTQAESFGTTLSALHQELTEGGEG